MLKTDAEKKWCPFAIASYTQWGNPVSGTAQTVTIGGQTITMTPSTSQIPSISTPLNRMPGGDMHYDCRCITTKCMAWMTTLGDDERGHCARLGYVP